MHLKFTAIFDVEDYKTHNVTKKDDILLLHYAETAREKVRRELHKIVKKNEENLMKGRPPVEIDVNMDIHYQKRSLDQNAWLWLAHTLEAAIVNNKRLSGESIQWNTPDEVTPQMIHDDYLERYAPRATVFVDAGNVDYLRKALTETAGRIMKETWHSDTQKMEMEIWKTSSYFNVREFCEFAEHIEDSLISYGVTLDNSVDFKLLIEDLQTLKNKAEVIEKDTIIPILTEPEKSAIVEEEFDIF